MTNLAQASWWIQNPRDRRRRAWRAAGELVAVAAVIIGVGLLLGLFVVGRHGGGPIQAWDDTVQRWSVHHRGPLVPAAKFVATYFDAVPLGVASAVLTVLLAVTLRTVRALAPLVAYLGGELQVLAIRLVIERHRPPTANSPAPGAVAGVHETSASFPSGHVVVVTAIVFALLGAVALTLRLWWPWLVAAAAALFVGDTRLVLGVHWFSDVAFGFVLGVAWGITVALVLRGVEWRDVGSVLRRR